MFLASKTENPRLPSPSRFPSILALGGARWLKLLIPLAIWRSVALIWGVMNIDETDFFVAARMFRIGALPYVDMVEKKPILAYLAYAPAALFGWHIWPLHILAIAWLLVTALVVCHAAARWTDDAECGWTASWIFVAAACCGQPAISTELQFNLPIAVALLCIAAPGGVAKDNNFFAGLLIGLASLFKHQAGIALVAFSGSVWLCSAQGRSRSRRQIALGLGFVLPWLLVGGVYAAIGHWHEFFEWNFLRNVTYGGHASGSEAGRLLRSLLSCVVLGAPIAWILAMRRIPGVMQDRFGLTTSLLFLLSWLPVSMGGRFYDHYFLQFVPPLAILAAPEATKLLRARNQLPMRLRRVFALCLIVPSLFWLQRNIRRGLEREYPGQNQEALQLADWIKANSTAHERMFVWGHFSPIYYLAERLPGTRYVNTSVHMGDFDPGQLSDGFDPRKFRSDRDVAMTLRDLERNKPELFVDTAPADIHGWRRIPLGDFPDLDRYLQQNYHLVGVPASARVYRRNYPGARLR